MQIKVCNTNGCAQIQVIQPSGEEGKEGSVVNTASVEDNQEVVLTVPGAVESADIQVGETTDAAAPATGDAGGQESAQEAGGQGGAEQPQ